jgi:hypothetical protein
MLELVIKQKPPYRLGIDMSFPHSRERTGLYRHRKWTKIFLSANGVAVPFIQDLASFSSTTPDYLLLLSNQKHPLLIRQGEYQP